MSTDDHQTLVKTFWNEQHELHHKINEWRDWWSELSELGEPRFGEMHDRLQLIRQKLRTHFHREEESGFLHENSDLKEKHSEQVTELLSDHRELLSDLDRLCEKLGATESGFVTWGQAKRSFDALLKELDRQEQIENQLMEAWTKSETDTHEKD
ncbi:MAG: hypothetical protein HUJ26_21885 [Planctomycetaceae bacterium]|nr:hypothetical protein [Planctomycetaceae bacterium]